MNVRDVMAENVFSLKQSDTLRTAAQLLTSKVISGAPVVDDAGKLVGIISEKDIFRALFPTHEEFNNNPELWTDFNKLERAASQHADITVEKIMTKKVVTVDPDMSIMRVGSLLLVKRIHRAIVVDPDNRIIGLVSRRDIYRNILRKELQL